MFARVLARIAILALVGALLGFAALLVGRSVLDWWQSTNPFWAVVDGAAVGAILGIALSVRIEAARRRASPRRR